jgi:hypothetical protein
MIKKAIFKGLAVGLLAFSAQAQEPAISFSGYLDADMGAYFDKDFEGTTFANQELDLTTNIQYNSKVSVQVYTTVLSEQKTPAGTSNPANRWGSVAFDGVTLTMALEGATAYVGDLVYAGGGFGYYNYKRAVAYGTIVNERFIRGAGIDYDMGLSVYAGVTDLDAKTVAAYLAYDLSVAEGISVKPMADVVFGKEDASGDAIVDYHAGFEFAAELGDIAVSGSFGTGAENDADAYYNWLIEPSLSLGNISIAAAYYQAVVEAGGTTVNGLTEDLFFYVEPGMSLSEGLAAGLPLEFHSYGINTGTNAASFDVVPTAYIYPIDNVEIWAWAAAYIPVADNEGDVSYGAGLELIASF